MATIKQLNIKNRTYYFYNDLINLKHFDPKLLKQDKKPSMNISIYYIGYVTKKPEYNINSVNPLYLLISELNGFIEEKEGSKYLNISLTYNNNDDYMKIKFNSDDNLPLNKIIKFCVLTIIIKNIFEKDSKYYAQMFLDDCLYEI